ncbi:hypothetical protein B0H14DRAFT_2918923 [Mycena olivaceomarginata]|nr:hypothetical protein B0H14DRAFT_2918923 [Mycena olivaceomarginata]
MTLRFVNPYSSEWELAGSCRGSATRGRLSRSPFSVYKGKKISGQADVLWKVDGKICARNLSRWETAPTEAKPNRGQNLLLIHNQCHSLPCVRRPYAVTCDSRGKKNQAMPGLPAGRGNEQQRKSVPEHCQQSLWASRLVPSHKHKPSSADGATEQSEECETIYAHSGQGLE